MSGVSVVQGSGAVAGATRRGFLKRAGAVVIGVLFGAGAFPRQAQAGTRCFAPGARAGCHSCHTGCNYGCSGLGYIGWIWYRNFTAVTQCCSDGGWNGCIGAYTCLGGSKWWMTYAGTELCCGCEGV